MSSPDLATDNVWLVEQTGGEWSLSVHVHNRGDGTALEVIVEAAVVTPDRYELVGIVVSTAPEFVTSIPELDPGPPRQVRVGIVETSKATGVIDWEVGLTRTIRVVEEAK